MYTSDDQVVECEAHVVVAVNDPMEFYSNVMKGKRIVSVDSIAIDLANWVQQTIEPLALSSTANELSSNPEARERIELDLRQTLPTRLARKGLTLVDIEHIQVISHIDWRIRKGRDDLNREKAMAEIDKAYKDFQAILSKDENIRRMNQMESDADLQAFIKDLEHQTFRQDLVRQQDREDLARDYLERKKNSQSASDHLIAQVELQRKGVLAQLQHEFNVEDIRRRHQEDFDKLSNQGTLDKEARRQEQQRLNDELTGKLQRERSEFDEKMYQTRATFNWELEAERLASELDAKEKSQKLELAKKAVDIYSIYKSGKQELAEKERQAAFEREQAARMRSQSRNGKGNDIQSAQYGSDNRTYSS